MVRTVAKSLQFYWRRILNLWFVGYFKDAMQQWHQYFKMALALSTLLWIFYNTTFFVCVRTWYLHAEGTLGKENKLDHTTPNVLPHIVKLFDIKIQKKGNINFLVWHFENNTLRKLAKFFSDRIKRGILVWRKIGQTAPLLLLLQQCMFDAPCSCFCRFFSDFCS